MKKIFALTLICAALAAPVAVYAAGSSSGQEDFKGFYPANSPDAYWVPGDKGANAMPLCDEIRGQYGKTPVTQNGACTNAAYRLGYTGADISKYFNKATKQEGTSGSYKGDSIGYKVTGYDGSAAMSVSQFYAGVYGLPKTYLNNWGKAAGEEPLIKKTDMSVSDSSDATTGYFVDEEKKKVFDIKTGKQREYFTTAYKDNNDAIASGACQLIAIKDGGKYTVTPGANGTYSMGGSGGKSMSVVPERIINSRHPFAPRDTDEWQELELVSGDNTTETCGNEGLLDGKKAWENDGNSTVSASSDDYTDFNVSDATGDLGGQGVSLGSFMDDVEYYKKPMEKKGKILSTPVRVAEYDVIYEIIFEICVDYTGDESDCDKLAKRVACRIAILPPVKPENYLKVSYNLVEKQDDLPWIYDSPGNAFSYQGSDLGLGLSWRNVTHASGSSSSSSNSSGTSSSSNSGGSSTGSTSGSGSTTYTSTIVTDDKFGYNMPPLIDWVTGTAGTKPLLQKTDGYPGKKSKEGWPTNKWEYWRTMVTGVNSRFKPDESNPEETGVQNFGAMYGGWNELIMYQANCNRFFGLNCICDYFKNFWKGSAIGYAMSRASGQVAMGNESHNEYTDVQTEQLQGQYDQYKYKKNVDKSDVKTWQRILNVKEGNQNFPALIGKKIPGKPGGQAKENWPGDGSFLLTGLDNAQVGDIIVWDNDTAVAGGYKRPLHAGYVERTMTKKDGSKCVQISESNNGAIRDAAGNTENWGRVTTRWLCNQDDQSYTFNQDGQKGLKDCAYNQMSNCWEKQWSQWKIYRYKNDTDRVTDPNTGEVKSASSACKDTDTFVQNEDQLKGKQTGGWKDKDLRNPDGTIDDSKKDPLIKTNSDLLTKLTAAGCPPPVKYQLKDRNMRAGGITTGQYTPTSPKEPVEMFDFVYNVRLDSAFQWWNLIPMPQINPTPPAQVVTNAVGSSSSGGGTLSPNATCGQIAIDYINIIMNTSGVTYKDDCAGNVAAPNSSTTCNGTQFGPFGIIEAAYNNARQTVNVDGLWSTAPAQAATIGGGVIAYNDRFDNQVNEPNGCRLTNLSPCGKAGDIVLLQSGPNMNRLTPYNHFLIFDGTSQFYEAQNQTGQVVRYGPLPPEYANSSYEVRHLSCND